MLDDFYENFLVPHGLFDALPSATQTPSPITITEERDPRPAIWATDGPWDIRDFVSKTCYIAGIGIPYWLQGDIVDIVRILFIEML